jgi:metal-sulfur cluster biosynthetic enzyme
MSETNKTVWQADAQDPPKAESLRQALREVLDPELGLSVIDLGLIRDLILQADKVEAKMILTTPFCPYGPALLEQTRRKIAEASGLPALVEMVPEPWSPALMEEGAGGDWGLF